ncbi:ABC transporter ATP-binding protein [Phaeovibrio sulfidiphilus]|uniref:ABC transporter ATP-binding protein n=1 Tax=Phaeovibrio sulfidiphilus TaxID=1220600 RepID=A0A8J6YQ30_9PROT|nr:ATP-binding cassette domain-containing protein [Phaeovibrio sulfidiphilus]MBE1237794.1 ABC transporter ATP-binding protein [Phaeovibrio sulfidiphilus]
MDTPSPAVVTVRSLTKRFGPDGPPALDALDAEILPGEITGLVGPDGAGKTTLIRLMTGLMAPTEGHVEVFGNDTRTRAQAVQEAIGYMPQRFGLYEDLSVLENLTLYAELRGLPEQDRPEVFAELLRFTDLARFTARLAGRLSGGMKQKLGLACALLKKPRLLLLDEPGVGVDPISRRELWSMVENLTREGIAVVWSTAYLDEAEACSRVLLLNEGKLLFAGPPGQLTGRTRGRVFRVSGFQGRKRDVLAGLLEDPLVSDGVIQGEALRLVLRQESPPERLQGMVMVPAEPRFEDSFVDLLGGGPGGRSVLAENTREFPKDDPKPAIEARGLTRMFGDFTAAADITFSVPRGEIFGLLGPNGAGKSTTFKMLCGLLKPTRGEGRVAGFDLRRDGANARNRLGYMAQKFSLYGDLSVAQNLDFFAGVYGLDRASRRARTRMMTEIFDLGPYARQSARDLPLGLKQRLALACSVMHEPDVLFLDEPTSGVDPITRREFWTHINGLVERGVSVLVTTHFMDEAEYCDRISLIYRGRSIALGSPDDLKASARSDDLPDPTMEDAFIALIRKSGADGEPKGGTVS